MKNINEKLKKLRIEKKMSHEQLARLTNLDRSTISRIESGERNPTVDTAQKISSALGFNLGTLILEETVSHRTSDINYIRNTSKLNNFGFSEENLLDAITHCYKTLDLIDFQLQNYGAPKLSKLVELANLSSIMGNIIGEGLALHSNKRFHRNKPHTFPDLLSSDPSFNGVEIKIALENNYPKGHLPKSGNYIFFRYVLVDNNKFERKSKNRGTTAEIWEVKCGYLKESDFNMSNTEGDSGKTAVVKGSSLNNMPLVYFNPNFCPYVFKDNKYVGFN